MSGSQLPDDDIRREYTFLKKNIKEKIDADENKNYFAYDINDKARYSFLDVSNFVYSKQMIKAFYWSIGIGTSFFVHRYFRTRDYKNGLKWGASTMFGSFIFVWGAYEIQPFSVAFLHSKQSEKKVKEKMLSLSYNSYKNTINKKSGSTQVFNSDFYARYFFTILNQLIFDFKVIQPNLLHNNSLIDFNEFLKIKLKYNPFEEELKKNSNIVYEIDDDLGIEEEEEFYIKDVEMSENFLKKYKIVSIWFDYSKFIETYNLNFFQINKNLNDEFILQTKDLAVLDDSFVSVDDSYIKDLIFKTKNVDIHYFPAKSIEDYRLIAKKNGMLILNNYNNDNWDEIYLNLSSKNH